MLFCYLHESDLTDWDRQGAKARPRTAAGYPPLSSRSSQQHPVASHS